MAEILFKMKDTYVTLSKSELKNYGYLQILYNNSKNDTIVVDKEEKTGAIIVDNIDPMLFKYLYRNKKEFFDNLDKLKTFIDYKSNDQLKSKSYATFHYDDIGSCFEQKVIDYGQKIIYMNCNYLKWFARLEIGDMIIIPKRRTKMWCAVWRPIYFGDKFIKYLHNALRELNMYYVPIKMILTYADDDEEDEYDCDVKFYDVTYHSSNNWDYFNEPSLKSLSEEEYKLYHTGKHVFENEDFEWEQDKTPIVPARKFDYRQQFTNCIALLKVDPKKMKHE